MLRTSDEASVTRSGRLGSPRLPGVTLLLPALQSPTGPAASREAVRFGALSLTYGELAAASTALAARIADAGRVAVWATPTPETVIAVVAALRAGVPAVPLNPRTGEGELAHILADSEPTAVLAGPTTSCPRGWGSCGG